MCCRFFHAGLSHPFFRLMWYRVLATAKKMATQWSGQKRLADSDFQSEQVVQILSANNTLLVVGCLHGAVVGSMHPGLDLAATDCTPAARNHRWLAAALRTLAGLVDPGMELGQHAHNNRQ